MADDERELPVSVASGVAEKDSEIIADFDFEPVRVSEYGVRERVKVREIDALRSLVDEKVAVRSGEIVSVCVGTIFTTGVTGTYDEFFASWQHANAMLFFCR